MRRSRSLHWPLGRQATLSVMLIALSALGTEFGGPQVAALAIIAGWCRPVCAEAVPQAAGNSSPGARTVRWAAGRDLSPPAGPARQACAPGPVRPAASARREVGEDARRAGPLEGREALHHGVLPQHAAPAAAMIIAYCPRPDRRRCARGRLRPRGARCRDRHSRFHHHHVGAFGEVERNPRSACRRWRDPSDRCACRP